MMSGKGGSNLRSQFREVKVQRADSASGKTRGQRGKQQEVPSLGVYGEAAVTDVDLPEDEQMLRAFDLTTKFGPCTGMTRLERWERAERFDLSPPQEVRDLLLRLGPDHKLNKCLWDGRV